MSIILKAEVNSLLNNSLNNSKLLLKDFSIRKNKTGISVINIPVLKNEKEYIKFVKYCKVYGYKKLNLGLTDAWNNKINIKIIKFLAENLEIISGHGTSIKFTLKNNIAYTEVLKRDLDVLNSLKLNNNFVVNYDLFAGNLLSSYSENFLASKKTNLNLISRKINLIDPSEKSLMLYLFNNIDEVYVNNEYKIVFEVPGTKGWSMLPKFNESNLNFISKYFINTSNIYGMCIDLGHLATWINNEKQLDDNIDLIKKYSKILKMIHISSSGTNNKFFYDLYIKYFKSECSGWHYKNLDLQLAVSEKNILILVDHIRKINIKNLLEVNEIRLPSHAILDYFPKIKTNFVNDDDYFEHLHLNSKILGYI